jgi:hypothetical protein
MLLDPSSKCVAARIAPDVSAVLGDKVIALPAAEPAKPKTKKARA